VQKLVRENLTSEPFV